MLPVFTVLAMVAAMGSCLWLAALNVKYRDFRFVIPFITQFGLYLTPVGFSSRIVPMEWRWFYSINPMVGVIDGFRWAISGNATPFPTRSLAISIIVSSLLLAGGIWFFRRTERTFADVI